MQYEPVRQVHLDFHTSEAIPGIGARFDAGQFQRALRNGQVELINVFAKCHHGWCYYPTDVGTMHPNLGFDLLGAQIAACHEIGIRAPVYFTVGWSAADAEEHPEWCMRNADGSFVAPGWDESAKPETPKPPFQWKTLCPSGEYHGLVRAHTEELLDRYEVDGLWYDIYQADSLCYCDSCRHGMESEGFDVENPTDVERFRAETIRRHCRELAELIHERDPDVSVYFNGLTALERPQNLTYRLYEFNTKHDLEDLPTTWGGYDKLPLRARLFGTDAKPLVAMSGKFHTAWGEFGGFKTAEAMRFEAASMIAYGARCNFGDHLHPSGRMDESTYQCLGEAFEYVKRIEEYGIPSVPASTLGLWVSGDLEADEGAARMLLEEHLDFDVTRGDDDLFRFETIVIPSVAGLLDEAIEQVDLYLSAGGTIVTLGEGALDAARLETVVDRDIEYRGPGEYDVDYTRIAEDERDNRLDRRLFGTPFLNYLAAERFAPTSDTTVLAEIYEPYFSRTYGAYCGHQNTPYRDRPASHPALFRRGNVVFLAHPLDRIYYRHGARVHRALFRSAVDLVLTHAMVNTELPSAGRVTLLHQPEHHRYVAHLLYGPPLQRGRCLVIEDLPRLTDVPLTIRLPIAPTSVRLEPDAESLPFEIAGHASGPVYTPEWADAEVRTTGVRLPCDFLSWTTIRTRVPSFSAHCAVVVGY